MQERLGSDVKVEEGNWAAQFGQCDPGPYETGLVGQEESDRVPFLEPDLGLQSSGHLVAVFIHLAIRNHSSFKVQEDLAGMPPRRIQEAVQEAVERFELLILGEPDAELDAPQDVHAVIAEVRETCLQVEKGQNGKSCYSGEAEVHFAEQ